MPASADELRPSPCREALRVCADDLGLPEGQVGIVPVSGATEHHRNQIYYVGIAGLRKPSHVIKQNPAEAYDPQHELEALRFAARVIDESGQSGLGAVQAVGYGTKPKFLVTRFQAGESPQPVFDAAVQGWRRGRSVEEARSYCRLFASWLSTFHAGAVRQDAGWTPDEYLRRLELVAGDARRLVGRRQIDALLEHTASYLGQLSVDERARMLRGHPIRGDARPKNFLMGSDAVLYALDMEGFGYGAMDHDLSCLHHSLEFDGVLSPAATRRASDIWREFWDEYMRLGNTPAIALLSYVFFVLDKMVRLARARRSAGWKRRARIAIWFLSRRRWLSQLSGDLEADTAYMQRHI